MNAAADRAARRPRLSADAKRDHILDAARAAFEADGLEGASLRGIAARAGYAPAALYFHFDSKEALYGEVLRLSIGRLRAAIVAAADAVPGPAARLTAAALAFFRFYRENPRDLDLGFYLFRGGMRPHGLGRTLDRDLNEALMQALDPIHAAALALGATPAAASRATLDLFAHATGLLLLVHTGRIRIFEVSADDMMAQHVRLQAERLGDGS